MMHVVPNKTKECKSKKRKKKSKMLRERRGMRGGRKKEKNSNNLKKPIKIKKNKKYKRTKKVKKSKKKSRKMSMKKIKRKTRKKKRRLLRNLDLQSQNSVVLSYMYTSQREAKNLKKWYIREKMLLLKRTPKENNKINILKTKMPTVVKRTMDTIQIMISITTNKMKKR